MRFISVFAAALAAVFLLSGCGDDRPERPKQPDLKSPISRPAPTPSVPVAVPEIPEHAHKLQYGTGFVAHWSGEDQFINRLAYDVYPNDFRYQFILEDEFYNTLEAQARGLVDAITGDLVSVPPRLIELRGPILLPLKTTYPDYYSGDWVLTYDGQADVSFASYQILEVEGNRLASPGDQHFDRLVGHGTSGHGHRPGELDFLLGHVASLAVVEHRERSLGHEQRELGYLGQQRRERLLHLVLQVIAQIVPK